MTRSTILTTAVALCLAAGTALAQGGQRTAPASSRDLSGNWQLDASKPGDSHAPPALNITMTPKTITIEPGGAKPFTLSLDGTEGDMPNGGKARVEWKGNTLILTMASARGKQTMNFTREGEMLVHEMAGPNGPQKTYFKRQPPSR